MEKRIKCRVSLEHSQGVVQDEKRLNRIDYCWGKPRVREYSHIGLLAGCNGPRGAKTPTLASSERHNYPESQQNSDQTVSPGQPSISFTACIWAWALGAPTSGQYPSALIAKGTKAARIFKI